MKNKKNIIIVVLTIIVLGVAIFLASLTSKMSVNGKESSGFKGDVKVISITKTKESTAKDVIEPTYTNTTVTFNTALAKPKEFAEYEIIVKNEGTTNSKLNSIAWTTIGSTVNDKEAAPIHAKYIVTSSPSGDDILKPNETATIKVKVYFDATEQKNMAEVLKLNGTLIYIQAD